MSKIVNRIKNLITTLPEKDIPLGYKFLDCRDFESLKELIDSAIYKVRKNQRSGELNKYTDINLEDLSRLKSEVDNYLIQIDISFNNDLFGDLESELTNEEDFY